MYINNRFSIFPCGWLNKENNEVTMRQRPQQTQTIEWVYQYVSSERTRDITERLRSMADETDDVQREFKLLNFEYATFSGIFSYRNASGLAERSPYLVLDIDNLASMDEAVDLRQTLSEDTNVETALCFVSPRGRGVKWVVELPEWTYGLTFKEQFDALRSYLGFTYGVDADKSGSDVSRACFLSYDKDCFINKKYLRNEHL